MTREGLLPGRGLELAVCANIGPVEALASQAVPDVARLVGDPLFVDVFVHARQEAHDLAAARIDADGASRRASMTSMDSVLVSSQGRAMKA